jgi:outer membrane protein assembly factor BamB
MPLLPFAPPQPVPVFSGFDYMTTDVSRRRIYAAHSGSHALLIVDADSGAIVGQVRVGAVHGVAVDPVTGHVFTGNGESRSVSEVDPESKKVLSSAPVDGEVDAVAYDPGNHRIYADEDDGNRIFVIDARTMRSIGTVALPGHHPEYLAVDPVTHDVYQNIADLNEFVIVDSLALSVKRTVQTPELISNHALQYDASLHHILVGGTNGVLSVYDPSGRLLNKAAIQQRVDQCDLDQATHTLACAGSAEVRVLRDSAKAAPETVASGAVPRGVHTTAIDGKTGRVWVVWGNQSTGTAGDFVQAFSVSP